MAVVYQHIREDKEEIFYIGIGKTEKRAYSTEARNRHWKSIVKNTAYRVEILQIGISWEDACALEKQLIEKLGRSDLGTGALVNMTSGGEGIQNLSEESREKISKTSTGRRKSEECKLKLSLKTRGENSPMYGKKGPLHPKFGKKQIFTQEHKDKLSKVRKGRIYSEEHKQAMRVPKGPQELKKCPHCDKEGGNAMTRWHFDNCKLKK
jgi:hypothetical protein